MFEQGGFFTKKDVFRAPASFLSMTHWMVRAGFPVTESMNRLFFKAGDHVGMLLLSNEKGGICFEKRGNRNEILTR